MEITGKFLCHYGVVEGEKNGKEWRKITFTIVTMDGHDRTVGFTAFGSDKVAMVQMLNTGDTVSVQFYPESREFNDRLYTELIMVRVMVAKPLTA